MFVMSKTDPLYAEEVFSCALRSGCQMLKTHDGDGIGETGGFGLFMHHSIKLFLFLLAWVANLW